MKSFRIGFWGLLFLVCYSLGLSGSITSSKGLGIPACPSDARSVGMAGLATAQPDPVSASGVNPAGLVSVRNTLLVLHFYSENNLLKTNAGQDRSGYSNFDGFLFSVPLKSGMGMAMQLRPLTRAHYGMTSRNTLDGQAYTKSVTGNGGMNAVSLSAFWHVARFAALGVSGNYLFGRIDEEWKVIWDDSLFVQSDNLYSFTHYGYGLTFGIQVAPIKRLLLGAGYSPEVRLHSTINLQYRGSSSATTRYDDTTYPASWSAGATAFINTTCAWGMEISGQHWSRLLYGQKPAPSLRNTLSFATGAEFYSLKDPMTPYWKKMAYRVGFVHRPFFSLDSDGGRIQEWWVTWGLGLPMSAGISQIDVSFGYGKRGSIGDNGFSEDLWKGALTVTVGEKWFTKGRR